MKYIPAFSPLFSLLTILLSVVSPGVASTSYDRNYTGGTIKNYGEYESVFLTLSARNWQMRYDSTRPKMEIKGFSFSSHPGYPIIPRRIVRVLLPPETVFRGLKVEEISTRVIPYPGDPSDLPYFYPARDLRVLKKKITKSHPILSRRLGEVLGKIDRPLPTLRGDIDGDRVKEWVVFPAAGRNGEALVFDGPDRGLAYRGRIRFTRDESKAFLEQW